MRDSKRLDQFCDRLKTVWHTVPDWRFGQLMSNIFEDMKASGRDPFPTEDDEMIEYLENYFGFGKKKLADLKPNDKFKIGNEVFIVLEQCGGLTKVITNEFTYEGVKFGNCSNWKNSPIRRTLNNEYFKRITEMIGADNILPMIRDLTSLDGLDDYGTCTDKVSLLTVAEYAKYHKILGLESCYHNWEWLITPVSIPSNDYARCFCYIRSSGALSWGDCGCYLDVRPILNLKYSIMVF